MSPPTLAATDLQNMCVCEVRHTRAPYSRLPFNKILGVSQKASQDCPTIRPKPRLPTSQPTPSLGIRGCLLSWVPSVDPQPDPRAPGASPAPSLGVPCSENTGDPTAPPCRLLDRPASTPHTSLRYCAAHSLAHCWVAHSWVAHSWGAHCWVAHCWGAPCACLWHDRLGITHASLPAAGRIASNQPCQAPSELSAIALFWRTPSLFFDTHLLWRQAV